MAEAGEQLGNFLRSRRERLEPEQLDFSGTRRRRTPGLRREEVASFAEISTEWYVKLEQGRAGAPSTTTVDALARALRLSEVEHGHLLMLARSSRRPAFVREEVPAPLRHLIESLDQPAYATGLRWDVLAWNGAPRCRRADRGLGLPPSPARRTDARARPIKGADHAAHVGASTAAPRSATEKRLRRPGTLTGTTGEFYFGSFEENSGSPAFCSGVCDIPQKCQMNIGSPALPVLSLRDHAPCRTRARRSWVTAHPPR